MQGGDKTHFLSAGVFPMALLFSECSASPLVCGESEVKTRRIDDTL
jgi:hypothetical protein